MEPEKLRKIYYDLGQNLEKVKLPELIAILGFAGLSVGAYAMTNYMAYKGDYSSSLYSGTIAAYSGLRLRSIYRNAVKRIERN